MLLFLNPIRFDYAGGNHRIIPTAIDSDIWGNYKVYFKTSDFTQNKNDDYYCIEKGQDELADQVSKAIVDNKEIVIFYDRYIGWKGFTAPKTPPQSSVSNLQVLPALKVNNINNQGFLPDYFFIIFSKDPMIYYISR